MDGKISRIVTVFFAAVFGLAAVAVAALGIYLCVDRAEAEPELLYPADEAQSQVASFLDAVCGGDFAGAEKLLLGTPSLGADRPVQEDVGSLVWDAFVDNLSYTLLGDCYATDSGVAQDVQITCLDIDATLVDLRQRSEMILAQLQETSEDISDLYDRENNYREDVVMQVVYTAAQEALQENSKTVTTTLTLNLIYLDDQWWIIPDDALIRGIFGGLAG